MSIEAVQVGWRDTLHSLLLAASTLEPTSQLTAWFRFGDAVLEVVSDHQPLVEELNTFYGDCTDFEPRGGTSRLRCIARAVPGSQFLALTFEGAQIRDPLEIALGPYRFLRRQPYVEAEAPVAGWRVLLHAAAPGRLLLASNGRIALIGLDGSPPEFVLNCIVGVAQSAQLGVLFLHGASVGIDGTGALLLGPSEAGKSTNALALAMRGHAFLGDDVAAVRPATLELLPFPKSAGLREGPLAQMLGARLAACRHVRAPGKNGVPRAVMRVSDMFPDSTSGPLPLQFAFVLDGLRGAARITPIRPGLGDLLRLRSMVVMDTTSSWGLSPGRDLMQLLAVVALLARLQCYSVELGSTEETAGLIESTMRQRSPVVDLPDQ